MENLFADDSDYEHPQEPATSLFVHDNDLERDRFPTSHDQHSNDDSNTVQREFATGTTTPATIDKEAPNPPVYDGDDDDILGLGSVNVKTRRKLVVLNDEQLLANSGLPYLRKHFKERVRFKSSTRIVKDSSKTKKSISFSTEFDNSTKMLQFYQLWAHSVFPKANFKDFVNMCYYKQSLYKNDRLVAYRRQWIHEDETKAQGEYEAQLESLRNENYISSDKNETSNGTKQTDVQQNSNDNNNSNNAQPVQDEPAFSDTEMAPINIPRRNGLFVGESDDESNSNSHQESTINNETANNHESQINKKTENIRISSAGSAEVENDINDSNNENSNSNSNFNSNSNHQDASRIFGDTFDDSFDDLLDDELDNLLAKTSKKSNKNEDKGDNNAITSSLTQVEDLNIPISTEANDLAIQKNNTSPEAEEFFDTHEAELEVLREMGL